MRKLLIAISFYTRIPIKLKDVSEEEFYNSMILMPFVGVFIGVVLYALSFLFSLIHFKELEALLLMITYIWLTGGLHLDGFADTTDALFSSRDREKMMVIMKDSRLGAFGAIGLILLLLTNWMAMTLVISQYAQALLVMPLFGRTAAIMSTCFCSYAQGGGGLGKRLVEMTKPIHFIEYFVMLLIYATLMTGIAGLLVVMLSYIPSILLMLNLQKRIGGMTGDTIGMTIELNQTFFMVIFTILLINLPSYFSFFTGIF
ncbi:MAG: adenosylcobinamide-GDP ribazoletransferase [Eubacteriaceae bacterium]